MTAGASGMLVNTEESASVALGLKNSGYTNVKVLQGPNAFGAWQSAGYPVETGP